MSQVYGYNAFKLNLRKKLQALDKNLKPAIYAKCYDCMGFYEDGIMDCGCSDCPLYPWMPYGEKS